MLKCYTDPLFASFPIGPLLRASISRHVIPAKAGIQSFTTIKEFIFHLLNFLNILLLMTKQLVFIGDSLTEWFDWQKRFSGYPVMNLGVSGEPVEGLLDRRDLIRSRIDNPGHIFLMTGINNIMLERYNIEMPYREIVRNLTAWYKKAKIIVQSILPVELPWISNDAIKGANLVLERIAGENDAEYLDIYRLFVNKGKGIPKSAYFEEDGVHLSSKGYAIWAGAIERFLAGQVTENSE